ncbi:hypothetical protein ERIC1_1c05770 [Paenibacillus larvae subsp. larvae DSM 25719]|uniref:Uncharacterized protein n=1 Tax=Paenibacillus larvae subsp. larvae DSM 25430 TaxID=697284 RepID=V9W703_9BACL|nr:hypothetical protein ERIC2_c16520 [Paenibacillus larvae subsp. larvae DSM 25430]ETK27135.1 hypothetical protein ERIC1_1c05770 [Paenibacillus larvae subsp. larvae DSM 25719]
MHLQLLVASNNWGAVHTQRLLSLNLNSNNFPHVLQKGNGQGFLSHEFLTLSPPHPRIKPHNGGHPHRRRYCRHSR